MTDAGHEWATAHTFRHTVCTLLGQAGLSWRDIVDHVGHKHASLTMDVHASRHTMSDRPRSSWSSGTSAEQTGEFLGDFAALPTDDAGPHRRMCFSGASPGSPDRTWTTPPGTIALPC